MLTCIAVMGIAAILTNQPNLNHITAMAKTNTLITITSPSNGATVGYQFNVQGTAQNVPSSAALWIAVFVPKSVNRYYPMDNPLTIQTNGDWSCVTTISGVNGDTFSIVTVLADENAQTHIRAYITAAKSTASSNYSGLTEAEWSAFGVQEYGRISVTLSTTLPTPTTAPPPTPTTSPTATSTSTLTPTPTPSPTPSIAPMVDPLIPSSTPPPTFTATPSPTPTITPIIQPTTKVTPPPTATNPTEPPTPTPSPTPLLIPATVKITNPQNNNIIEKDIKVSGTVQNLKNEEQVWVVIHQGNCFYPNPSNVTVDSNGDWTTSVVVGGPNDTGVKFEIYAILAGQNIQAEIGNYLNQCQSGSFPGIAEQDWITPEVYDKVAVTRETPLDWNAVGVILPFIGTVLGVVATIVATIIIRARRQRNST